MRRKWVILTCVVYIIAGVWSLPVEENQPVSNDSPTNVSSLANVDSSNTSISKSPIESPALDPKENVTVADSAVKALTENKTVETEVDDTGNATDARVDKKESDASKVPQSTAPVVQDGKGNAVSESESPKAETPGSNSGQETQNPESRKVSVEEAVDSPKNVSQKSEDIVVQTKQPSALDDGSKVLPVPGTQEGTIAAEAEKSGGSDAAESEGNKNTEVKIDPATAPAQESQPPKVDATVDGASKAESMPPKDDASKAETVLPKDDASKAETVLPKDDQPSGDVQPPVVQQATKAPVDDFPKSSASDTGTVAFGSDGNGDGSSMAGNRADYSESYASSADEEEYDEESKDRIDTSRDGVSLVNNGGQFTDDADSHFFAYFLTIMVTAIIFYLVFHNKQRIIALIIEGRAPRNGRTRRASSRAKYHKLDNNLEEAITATKGTNGC